MRVWAVALAVLFAGCSDGGGGEERPADDAGLEEDPGQVRVVCVDEAIRPAGEPNAAGMCPCPDGTYPDTQAACPPVIVPVPVDFDGNLGTSFSFCDATTGNCYPPLGPPVADETDYLLDQPGWTLDAVDLVLTWDSTTPATDRLAIGVMRMGTNSTAIDLAEGTSPLGLQVDGIGLPLDADNQLHVYVYNPQGVVANQAGYGYASVDLDFHLEGTVALSQQVTCGNDASQTVGEGPEPAVVRCIVPSQP